MEFGTEYLDEDNDQHFNIIFGGNIPIAHSHNRGGAEVKRIEIKDKLILLIDIQRREPVSFGVQ